MTWVPVRVGCSVFHNNRYYDPQVGIFLSVDPLVSKTGTPYLYAGGSPATYSDASGLDRFADQHEDCKYADLCEQQTACIMSSSCGGENLVDSIDDTKSGLGGAVFSGVEGADVGGHLDGNWGNKSVDAAASGGVVLLDALRALGIPEDQLPGFARLVQSVGQRLQGHSQDFERIDHEKSWWERHGNTLLNAISTAALISSLVLGPEAAFAAGFIAAAADSANLAYHMGNGTCGSGCDGLALDIPVDILSGGLALGGKRAASMFASAFQFTFHQTSGEFDEPHAWDVNVSAVVAVYFSRTARG